MSNKNLSLSHQKSPRIKNAREKAVQKLDIALKVTNVVLKVISIIEKIIAWMR